MVTGFHGPAVSHDEALQGPGVDLSQEVGRGRLTVV